jgi:protein-tyrosine kinase
VGLIEQAAKRLEELRRAGIEVPVAEAAAAVAERVEPAPFDDSAAPALAGDGPGAPEAALARVSGAEVHDRAQQPARRSQRVDIDLQRLAAAGYVTPTAPRSRLADELRVIKRPLIDNAQRRSAAPVQAGNLIMISSAVPGEGKTFMAINLAMSVAMELDNTVLLVDADVARPAILERLGLPPTKGLLDLLTTPELDVADVLLRTNVERLSVLPAGTPHSRATELLASDGMNRLVEELATRYPERILIFDAPPLLSSTESRVLASHMGQVVVVVEADRTPQSSVNQALVTIEDCPVVMLLLNKVEHSGFGSYYGYYGAYGQ